MEKYREFVKSLAKARSSQVFLNTDEDKMKVVMIEIFHHAKANMRIFAGNLFCQATNSTEYISAMSDFIESGGELRILVNKFNAAEARESNLYKRLYFYSTKDDYKEKISVHTTNSQLFISQSSAKEDTSASQSEKKSIHFAVGDDMSFRIETDTEKRSAVCCMNDKKMSSNLIDIFDTIFTDRSETLDLSNLFA